MFLAADCSFMKLPNAVTGFFGFPNSLFSLEILFCLFSSFCSNEVLLISSFCSSVSCFLYSSTETAKSLIFSKYCFCKCSLAAESSVLQAMQAQFKANRSHHRTKEWDRVFFKSMKRLEKLQNMYEEYYELVVSISCKINIKYLTNQQMIYWDFPESDGVSVPS